MSFSVQKSDESDEGGFCGSGGWYRGGVGLGEVAVTNDALNFAHPLFELGDNAIWAQNHNFSFLFGFYYSGWRRV